MRPACASPSAGSQRFLFETQDFVRLQTELPLRVGETILHREAGIFFPLRTVERLQEEVFEPQMTKALGLRVVFSLRVDQF
jgi:hypothetical protein